MSSLLRFASLIVLVSVEFGCCKRALGSERIGYVSYKNCTLTKDAVEAFCEDVQELEGSVRCTDRTEDAFLLRLPRLLFMTRHAMRQVEEVAKSIQERTSCRILFYAPPSIVFDNGKSKHTFQNTSIPLSSAPFSHHGAASQHSSSWKPTLPGVTIFVMDSGILREHLEFRIRRNKGFRVFSGVAATEKGKQTRECMEHGTQVAGVAAGGTVGVAPDSLVIDVATVPCPQSKTRTQATLAILRGLHFVEENAQEFRPSILLLPFHFDGVDLGVEEWIDRIGAAGVFVVSSSGNKPGACGFTPARMKNVLAVGASDAHNRDLVDNNLRSCVEIYARGNKIRTASAEGINAYKRAKGTSISAALVAGVAANILRSDPNLSPASVRQRILDDYAITAVSTAQGTKTWPLLQVPSHDEDELGTGRKANAKRSKRRKMPGFALQPSWLPVIDLFKNTREASTIAEIHIYNYGMADLHWSSQLESIHEEDQLRWIRLSVENGTLAAASNTTITARFSSEFENPGLHQALIYITTNDPRHYHQQIPVRVRIFCQETFTRDSQYEISIEDPVFSDTRPESWDPPALTEPDNLLYMEATLRFSQPVELWDLSEIYTEGDAILEAGFLQNNELCGKYTVRMTKPKMDVFEGKDELCLSVSTNTVFDIRGIPFPQQTTCAVFHSKPASRFYALFFSINQRMIPATMASDVTLLLSFSTRVTGFNDSSLVLSQGYVTSVTVADQAEKLYLITIALPSEYFGSVSVSLMSDDIKDARNNTLEKPPSFWFERVEHLWIQPATVHFES